MSQRLMRKGALVPSKTNCVSIQAPTAKAADDSHLTKHSQGNKRSSSKNKIPKNVRDDLENALVGLCDVWFEEIKPHLVRNNIKLHVHGSVASASGDHQRQQLPTAAPICSHFDPGAAPLPQRKDVSCVSCSLMRPIASRAPSVKLQAHNRPKNQPSQQTVSLQAKEYMLKSHKFGEMQAQKLYKAPTNKKRRSSPIHTRSNWRVPRLCRTYSIIPSAVRQTPKSTIIGNTYYKCVASHRRPKLVMKDKSVQTELSIPTGHVLSVSTQTKESERVRNCSTSITCSSSVSRRQTTPLPMNYRKRSKAPPLFQTDLIDIIGEKYDERLKIIYNSPPQMDYPSLMNLVSQNKPKKSPTPKKVLPWR